QIELASGDAEEAGKISSQLQAEFHRLGQSESEWRGGLLGALGKQRLGGQQLAYDQAAQAAKILGTLQTKMGGRHLALYLFLPDIKQQYKQLNALIPNNKN